MRKAIFGVALTLLMSFAAAQASHPPNLVQAAHQLDRAATWTWHTVSARSHRWGHDHRRHAARDLARAANRFHRNVERGLPLSYLHHDFRRVEQHYQDLRHQLMWGSRGQFGVFSGITHRDLRDMGVLIAQTRRSLMAEGRWR